jgi:hypothetical protein
VQPATELSPTQLRSLIKEQRQGRLGALLLTARTRQLRGRVADALRPGGAWARRRPLFRHHESASPRCPTAPRASSQSAAWEPPWTPPIYAP